VDCFVLFFKTHLPINITIEQAEKRAAGPLVLLHASSDQANSQATRVFLAFHPEKVSFLDRFHSCEKASSLASARTVIELKSRRMAPDVNRVS